MNYYSVSIINVIYIELGTKYNGSVPWPFNLDSEGNSPERDFIIREAKRAWGYESPFPDLEHLKQQNGSDNIFRNLRIDYEQSRNISNQLESKYGPGWQPSSEILEDQYCKDPKKNLAFPEYDAFVLDSMIREFRPTRILEFGSGWSTRVMTSAVNSLQLNTQITCIDKYADDLVKKSLKKMKVDFEEIDIVNFNPEILLNLKENDIFFIDSSHVLKNFGDVEFIYSYLFPIIPAGVIVHVHDIFLPYNYPKTWIVDWRSVLTEQHILGSWLDNRREVKILSANNWNLQNGVKIPESLEYKSGGSFWFKV
jgi:hypothetical protein